MNKKEKWQFVLDNKNRIISLYSKEFRTCDEIAQLFNLSRTIIIKLLRYNNIQIRPVGAVGIRRKYSLNESYFENINSSDKAYFLGWLMSDGYIADKRNDVAILLQEKDKEILELFKKYLKTNHPIFNDNYKLRKLCKFTIASKKMNMDLKNLGCSARKSLTLKFPSFQKVPKNLIFHFLRGYFEGDGSIGIYKNKNKYSFKFTLCGTKEFLYDFINLLKPEIENIFVYRNKKQIDKNVNMYMAVISRKNDIINLLNKLYKDSNELVLSRKYNIYQNMLNFIKNNPVNINRITRKVSSKNLVPN